MEDSIDNIASESAGPMRREACLKTECLARDGSRCVMTGLFDEDSLDASNTSPSTYTACVHIIPFSLASWSTEPEGYAKSLEPYDLPRPELLKVHAIIARIFHASGAVEHVEKALRDLGEHCVLAKDGSTGISSMLAATTLGILGSRAGSVQQTRAAFPDSKTSAQSVQNNVTDVDRRLGE
ncbi:unnamed protein product [Penicillium glandicola]